ncbi:MAG TPA: rod shape-determining protein RodA [Gaiellaceae bacterium]|nr:rod shape-determining protein RodA [Gaiellaceae bacterium]
MAVDVSSRSRQARVRSRARRAEAEAASLARRVDWLLVGSTAALVAYGLRAIDGITHHDVAGSPHYFVVRQGIFAGVGLVALLVSAAIDTDLYRRFGRVIFGGTILLMAFIFVAGPVTRGSRRWIDLGFFRFQPSEFGKLLFILFLAGYLADRSRRVSEGDRRTTLTALGLGLVPIGLVFLQPDFGTALVYGAALVGVLFVAGARWTHLAVVGAAAVVGTLLVLWILPGAGVHVLKSYQEQRLVGFTNPSKDPSGATYNVNQSIISVGAGGLRGRGVAGATQTSLDYLPEHATDFVFASLAEQRGFVGTAILLLLYLLVVWRGLRIVTIARDGFSSIAAGGIVVAFLFQVFVNVGMTMGIAPITGIPLPFVSVGGSSMIANLAAVGVLLGINARSRRR